MLPLIKFGKIEAKPATVENKQIFRNEAGPYYEVFAYNGANQQMIIRIDRDDYQFCTSVKDVFEKISKDCKILKDQLDPLLQQATKLNQTQHIKLPLEALKNCFDLIVEGIIDFHEDGFNEVIRILTNMKQIIYAKSVSPSTSIKQIIGWNTDNSWSENVTRSKFTPQQIIEVPDDAPPS